MLIRHSRFQDFSCKRVSTVSVGILCCFFALLLLSGTVAAQSETNDKQAMAERLAGEGSQLYQAGTKESLEAALQKFAAALPLFHALNDRIGEAIILTNIGLVYNALGEKQK
jgi:hypothetical protein